MPNGNGDAEAVNQTVVEAKPGEPMPENIKAFLETGSFQSAFRSPEFANALKALVSPGELAKIDDLHMRLNLVDRQMADDFGLLLEEAAEFEDQEVIKLIRTKMELYCSIKGYARDQLVTAIIGQQTQNNKQNIFHKMGDFFSGKNKGIN